MHNDGKVGSQYFSILSHKWGQQKNWNIAIKPLFSTTLFYTSADARWSIIQAHQWYFVIPHGIRLHPSNRTGQRVHATKFHQPKCYPRRRQYAVSVRFVSFLNKLPAEIVNALSMKAFKILLEANSLSLFTQPIPSAHMTSLRNSHPHDPFYIPPRVVVCSIPFCSLGQ